MPSPPCCAGPPPRRSPSVAIALIAGAALASLLAAREARPDCTPDMPSDGATVICTGTDSDGFDPGTALDLRIRVQADASVSNSGAAAIQIVSGSRVVVAEGGEVSATDAEAIADAGAGSNTIQNSGELAASGDDAMGVRLGVGSTVENGTVDADTGATLTSGEILVEGERGIGAWVAGDATSSGSVVNAGNVDVAGGDSIGIRAGEGVAVENTATGLVRVRPLVGGSGLPPRGVVLEGPSASLVNAGEIRSESGVGVDAVGAGATIENRGEIRAVGSGTTAVELADGLLDNRGVVIGDGVGAVGVLVDGAAARIDNRGRIEGGTAVDLSGATGPTDLTLRSAGRLVANGGVAVAGSGFRDVVELRGQVQGDVLLAGGDDELALATGGSVAGDLDGGAGSDALRLRGGGGASLNLDRTAGFETLDLEGGRWALRGTGAVATTTLRGGTLAAERVASLTGSFVQDPGSTLEVTLDPVATSGRLDVGGSATINGGRLQLSSRGAVPDGSSFTLMTAGAGISGGFDEIAESAVLDYTLSGFGSNALLLSVTRSSYAGAATHHNQRVVADALDFQVGAPISEDMNAVLGALDVLGPAALQDAFDALSPEAYDAHTSTALALGRHFTATLLRPPPLCRYEAEAGPGEPPPLDQPCRRRAGSLWITGHGDFTRRDGDNGHIDWDSDGGGLAAGYALGVGRGFELGVGLGVARTHLDVHDVGNGSVTGIDFGGHGAWRHGPFSLRGALGYGLRFHRARRSIDIPGVDRAASSDYLSRGVSGAFEASGEWRLSRFRFEPFAGLDAGWLIEPDFDESDAGAVALDVDERRTTLVALGAGLRIRTLLYRSTPLDSFYDLSDALWRPELRIAYRRVLTGADRDVEARLAGGTAGTPKIQVHADDAESMLLVGAGLDYQPLGGITVGLHYDAQLLDGTVGHRIQAQLRVPLALP